MPQTPPVGTPGGAHPYLHQRSQSTHSTPTPTSAHSQHQYGVPYGQGSPILAHHQPPPQAHEAVRHPSLPPTPLGPPLPASQRAASGPSSFAQPQSPYQHKLVAAAGSFPHPSHASPPPPLPPSIPRRLSHQGSFDQQVAAELHRRSQSRSERDRSISVSPKTRIPSLPSSAGKPARSIPDSDLRHYQSVSASIMESERENAVTPAKRKLDERDLRLDELERREPRPPPFERVNGSHSLPTARASRVSMSPVAQRKMKPRYAEAPIWARRYADEPLNSPNFVIRKVGQAHGERQTSFGGESVSRGVALGYGPIHGSGSSPSTSTRPENGSSPDRGRRP